VQPYATLEALAAGFDLAHLSRSPSRFDTAELEALNAKLLHVLPFDDVAMELKKLNAGLLKTMEHDQIALRTWGLDAEVEESEWLAIRGNLTVLAEVRIWHQVIHGSISAKIEDAAFCTTARDLLPPEPWDETTWGTWTNAVKAATGAKGRALFHPLRLALTGRENGPELKALLPLIGRARAVARLGGSG
jgi:glutamyl-tRNA synthetase